MPLHHSLNGGGITSKRTVKNVFGNFISDLCFNNMGHAKIINRPAFLLHNYTKTQTMEKHLFY